MFVQWTWFLWGYREMGGGARLMFVQWTWFLWGYRVMSVGKGVVARVGRRA
jgi:hypothetical protein